METVKTRAKVRKFYVPGKNFWLSRHDACALYKSLGGHPHLSKSVCRRLRKGLWNEILKPLYLYEVNCTQCGCKLEMVCDKELTSDEVREQNKVKGLEDLGIICGRCCEDYK